MKGVILILCICLLMIKCTVKEGPFSPSLIRVVDEITNMNPDNKIVQVITSELNGHNILYLTSSNTYNPDFVDGYFIYKGRLITYFQTDSINRRNLVNEKELLRFKDNIHGYKNAYYSSVNSEPTQELFEVNKNNIIRVKDIRRFVDCDCKANKTTVFFNNNLEHTLHAYIKNNPAVLYEVRFWQQGKKQFVFWRPMPYYDRDKYDGYLFWGNHLVVLYGTKYAGGLLRKTWIIKGKAIPKFRYKSIKDWNYPFPLKLEILSNGSIKTIPINEGFFIRDIL